MFLFDTWLCPDFLWLCPIVVVLLIGCLGLRRTTGFGIPGPNDTKSIVEVSLGLFDLLLRGACYDLPPRLVNFTITCASTYLSAFLTLQRNHHWVIGHCLSGWSAPVSMHIHTHTHTHTWLCPIVLWLCHAPVRMNSNSIAKLYAGLRPKASVEWVR